MSENLNKSSDLTELLFDTLRGIKEGNINIGQAKAISDVSGRIIEVARTEIEFAKVSKQKPGSGFFPSLPAPANQEESHETATGIVTRTGNLTTHRMR